MIVEATGSNVEATTFLVVERIVQLGAFDNVASCFDIVAGVDGALHCSYIREDCRQCR